MKNFSVVIAEDLHQKLFKHLIRRDRQEDLCFGTYIPARGNKRYTGIISSIIFPEDGDRFVHGNVSFMPQFFERALKEAQDRREGLVFFHSHPAPGWQGMSNDDVVAETRLSPSTFAITNLPLLGLTLGNDSAWSARFWLKDKNQKRTYIRNWCESVRVIDKGLKITYNEYLLPSKLNTRKQLRTISAWGEKTQKDLSRLKIGIVGLGSVGSIVAEILARTGFSRFALIDFDSVEEKNLDRLTNVFKIDIGRAKVFAIRDAINRSASSPKVSVDCYEYSICETKGFKAALDCDVLFSCVDRPWPRQVLNFIAYAHLIPVIDGGILVRTNECNTKLIGADWKAQTVGYQRPCLECLGQYNGAYAALEKSGRLDDPSYIRGLEPKSTLNAHENVYAFSSHLASLEVLQLLSLFIQPSNIADVGQQMHHFVLGSMDKDTTSKCLSNCYFQSVIGKGGQLPGSEVGMIHKVAREFRKQRKGQC